MAILRRHLALLVPVVICSIAAALADEATKLDVDRLFQSPNLSGTAPRAVKISPDSTRVTFLKGNVEDRFQLDLWEYSIEDNELRVLVDSKRLRAGPEQLSDEEIGRRERQRLAGLKGIVDYHFSPDGRLLLFPLSGDLYVYHIADGKLRQITRTGAGETDPQFSSTGRYLSFVRDQDLFAFDLETDREVRITTDGGGVIRNGMAEFIAQEEMDRDTGYWWAPDDSAIAFARVDESTVEVVERFEVYAEEFRTYSQRYPSTGTPNAVVQLGVYRLDTGETVWMDLGEDPDFYLARVTWLPDNTHVAAQRLSRDQQSLDLLKLDAADGAASVLLTETSDTWINLHHELTFLESRPQFVWASERSGFKHLYLYDNDGTLERPLTTGDWEVSGISEKRALLHIDEDGGNVYFMATKDTPLERHVYVASMDGDREPRRISRRPGVHEATFAKSGAFYVDHFSNPDTPPQIAVHDTDGGLIEYVDENRLDGKHPFFPYLASKPTLEFGTLDAADGQRLHYRLIRPAGFDASRSYPVIVFVYGGPHGQLVTREWSANFTEVLASKGFLVFTLDNRGTGHRGVAFDAPIFRLMGDVEIEDQLAGVEYLRSLPYVDGERIGIFGWSYGGYMALMSMFKHPGTFAAGVSGAPVTDWTLYDTNYTERYLGTPQDNPDGYEASSVFPYVDNLDAPLLVMHGMADDNVLFTNSTKLFKRLQSAQKNFDSMTYPGSKHGLTRHPETGPHAMKMILRYFNTHLKD